MEIKLKKRGRPVVDKAQNKRLPDIRVSEEQLINYKAASERSNKSFSAWVRGVLDKSSK